MAKIITQLPGGSGGGTSIHNELQGLNVGDYIHLTAAEKDRLDNINTSISPLLREDLVFSGSQLFTLLNNYSQVWSIDVTGQGALSPSQYTLIAPNQILINDILDVGDYLVILYSGAEVGTLPYFTQLQTNNLLVGLLHSDKIIKNEVPIGVLNGINPIFTTINSLVANSEDLYVNGNKMKKPDDYNISGQIITLTFSPQSTETILINYIKQ